MTETTRTFGSDVSQLAEIRSFLAEICQSAWSVDVDDDALCQLELAVQEAATNIIRHAYAGQAGQPIIVTVGADDDSASVSLRHVGAEFDAGDVEPPRFDGSRSGGFGVFLIRQLVDDVSYECDAAGQAGVRLLKRRRLRPEVDAHAAFC